MRQIGVAIGLTVILTFPVTLVSGAGSQKRADDKVNTSSIHGKSSAQGKRLQQTNASRPGPNGDKASGASH